MSNIKLHDIYKSIINEATVSRDQLIKAIEDRKRISIYYDSPYGTEDKGWRRIEPYCYGINKAGNMCLRAFQLNGASDTPNGNGKDPLTKIPGWRMFRIDGIHNINFGGGDTFDEPRVGYNENDKDMSIIYRSVSFYNDEELNPNDVISDKSTDNLNKDKHSSKIDINKEPIEYEGDDDKRLRNKPDWVKKFINRFKQLVNYKK